MTPEHVKRELKSIGLKPQIAAGQNFLLDENVVQQMIEAADVQAGDRVLEIGPGLGILTEALLNTGAEVIAVELDQRLAEYVRHRFSDFPGFTLVQNDMFKVRLDEFVQDGQYKLVANLPYSATALVFRNFLSLAPRPSSLTVMVQSDVADRITAEAGDLSVLAVMIQHYSRVTKVCDVPATSFFPVPKVNSSVIHLSRLQPVRPTDKHLFRIIRAGFSARRKQLVNSLAGTLHREAAEIAEKLAKIGVNPTARAQEIPVETWTSIADVLT